jgi:formylglycine-generating enzyme required for sulfatase activity
MHTRFFSLIGIGLSFCLYSQSQTPSPTQPIGTQLKVHGLLWDAHEVTVAQVKRFAQSTGFVSRAEKEGGGFIYESGFVLKKGWTWRAPFGIPAQDNEPAVHLTFDEAQKICEHEGKRLPRDTEWVNAAYVEQRSKAPDGFISGKRYRYPNGDSARDSHCLEGCSSAKGTAPSGALWRGAGHVPVMTTRPGVNGLYDMGANVWEWLADAQDGARLTAGGSWWYGPSQMKVEGMQYKTAGLYVVYVGFRCVY